MAKFACAFFVALGVVVLSEGASVKAGFLLRRLRVPELKPPEVLPVLTANSSAQVVSLHAATGQKNEWVVSFRIFYNIYQSGPGIWKWTNSLDAYDRHFLPMANTPLKLVEIGVQSGGSIMMWRTVLGTHCHVFGLDINPATKKFTSPMTTITIGDQGDPKMWASFFANVAQGPIDILVDDGGHEPHQMMVTLQSSFDYITPGGAIAIEDIHGVSYVESFFVPAAQFLGLRSQYGQVQSVHVYPFLLMVHRAGFPQRAPLQFHGSYEVVAGFDQMWAAIPRHPGGFVVLENAGWGPFLTPQGLTNFVRYFGQLHTADWYDQPAGCQHTSAAVCTVTCRNGQMQAMIKGVHIYPTRLIVEVPAGPPVIDAVRRGTDWLPY